MHSNFGTRHDIFSFRSCARPGGGLFVWFRYHDQPEVGPIELSQDEEAKLSDQVERATRILSAAMERHEPDSRRGPDAQDDAGNSSVAGRPKLRVV